MLTDVLDDPVMTSAQESRCPAQAPVHSRTVPSGSLAARMTSVPLRNDALQVPV